LITLTGTETRLDEMRRTSPSPTSSLLCPAELAAAGGDDEGDGEGNC